MDRTSCTYSLFSPPGKWLCDGRSIPLRALHPGALPMNKLVLLYTNSRIVSMISLKGKNHPDPQSPVHPHAKTAKRENVAWRFHHSGHLSLI